MRLAILVITVWTMLAAPALCMEGVVTHSCVCDSVQECSHEADCSYDPCNEVVLRSNSGPESDSASVIAVFEVSTQPAQFICSLVPSQAARPDAAPNLNVHPSDLPLLI